MSISTIKMCAENIGFVLQQSQVLKEKQIQ